MIFLLKAGWPLAVFTGKHRPARIPGALISFGE
jgi:hypothetical protein